MRRGSLFQIRGAEKQKARDPNDRLCRGINSWWEEDEHKDLVDWWCCKRSVRYGVRPVCNALIYMGKPDQSKTAEGRLGWGQNHRGRESPSGVQGRSPGRGSGGRSSRKLKIFKVVTCKFWAFLVVFHTFLPIYAYVFPCLQASFH